MACSFAADLPAIARAAVAAPSADNRHCFELRATADRLLLFGDARHVADPYHKRVLNHVSFGAVVENVVIRAARLGHQASVTWFPDPGRPALIAELRLSSADPLESALDSAIAARHTNRRVRYTGPGLANEDLRRIQAQVGSIDGVTLHLLDSAAKRAQLLRLVRIAEAERFNTRALHEDLFSAVRFDVGWKATAETGLPPGALGVEAGMRSAFGLLRHWPLMNVLRQIGLHHVLAFRAASLPCRLAPHCGVLTTCLPIERGALAVGMALERIWLVATSLGLAFQPFAGAALLSLADYREVPVRTGERLRNGWLEITTETPIMVFRLGHADAPMVRTGRLPPESVLRS